MLNYQQKLLLFDKLINTKTVNCYLNRNFCKSYKTAKSYALQRFAHIKRPAKAQYIIFDIDKIDKSVFDNVFYNNFSLLPNFYICEFSKNKQCYTLQLFYKISDLKINDDFITNIYKKLCLFFGADLQYQLKTGIHKNLMFENFDYINQENLDIKLLKSDYIGFLHNNEYNTQKLRDTISIIELFGELPSLSPTPVLKTAKTREKQQTNAFINIDLQNVNQGERNITLFNKVRFYAYETTNKTIANISDYANRINSKLAEPLPKAEVNATARSVYKYVNSINKTTTKQAHAFFTAEQAEKGRQSQQLQAIRTITRAILQLKKTGKNITFSAIKKITKQNINTIKKYINLVLDELQKTDQLSQKFPIIPKIVKKNNTKKIVKDNKKTTQINTT